ncbi:MAG: SAM-dependent methyltransferase [Gammaproteobacteria bacterium]|nr:SAM-dependent methyltransferase [Gammaproteobacteria bacterium]
MDNTGGNIPRFSIALISATALCYEILLARLFAIIQWHHFAYMIISLALLGYGVSGAFLSVFAERLRNHFAATFIVNILLFGLALPACFLLAQHIPFNAEEILWDWRQQVRLFGIYLLLMLPFFFAANAIGLSMMVMGGKISRIYAADMMGAGIGSALVIALLFYLMPNQVLQVLAVMAAAAACAAWIELRLPRNKYTFALAIALLLPVAIPNQWLELSMSPYKGLQQLLRIDGTQTIKTLSSPLGLVHVVESKIIPLRHAPGLSLYATIEPPPQLAVFSDGDNMTVINKAVANMEQLVYFDQQTSAAPYHLLNANTVAILGAGTGNDVLQALYHEIPDIHAVELNPQITGLLTGEFAEYSGNLYLKPQVQIHVAEARGFIASSRQHYDVIQIAMLDAFGASSAGLYALSESYLYTTEAFQDYLNHLTPNGFLSITRWVKLPPRDNLKMFATALQALENLKVEHPEKHLLLVRSWQTATLLVKKSELTGSDIEKIKSFCTNLGFDTAYYPGIEATEANRFNILREPVFFQATTALAGDTGAAFTRQYKFNIAPATDDRPYFFNFFKWGLLSELIALKDQGGIPLVEWGYMVLIATLIQAVAASAILILLPLIFSRKNLIPKDRYTAIGLLYFFSLGLAFLFIEVAFIQKFVLFLHHPLYAIAVTLAAFLLFAGMGSHYSKHLQTRFGYSSSVRTAITGIIVLGIFYTMGLGTLFSLLLPSTIFIKIPVTLFIIAPLAFFMGMPFPLALSTISESVPALVPWVWGVNGCASVISAILAMILAMHFGFTVVIVSALMLYLAAMLLFAGFPRANSVSR